jgi:hypothetical protein
MHISGTQSSKFHASARYLLFAKSERRPLQADNKRSFYRNLRLLFSV